MRSEGQGWDWMWLGVRFPLRGREGKRTNQRSPGNNEGTTGTQESKLGCEPRLAGFAHRHLKNWGVEKTP